MAQRTKASWWSWADIVANAHRLGIPHFQRGSVWDASSRVALLESLQFRSPCGSMVVWPHPPKIKATASLGVPLLDGHHFVDPKKTLWLVDGQQRSRTLLGIFREAVNAEIGFERHRLTSRGHVSSPWLAELNRLSNGSPALFGQLSEDLQVELNGDIAEDAADELGQDGLGDAGNDATRPGAVVGWFVSLSRASGSKRALEIFDDRSAAKAQYPAFRTYHFDSTARRKAVKDAEESRDEGRKAQLAFNARFLFPLPLLFVAATQESRVALASAELKRIGARTAADLTDADCDWLDTSLPWGVGFVAQRPDLSWREWRAQALPSASLTPLLHFAHEGVSSTLQALFGLFQAPQFARAALPKGTGFDDAVTTYVRINRAGVRVTAEERALATLSRFVERLPEKMAAFFALRDLPDEARQEKMARWKAEPSKPSSALMDLRIMDRSGLRHVANRSFAFDLWMRVVTRFAVLRILPATGIRWTDSAALDRPSVLAALEAHDETPLFRDGKRRSPILSEATERASAAVLLVDDIFARELFLDDRMLRPELENVLSIFEHLSLLPMTRLLELYGDPVGRQQLADLMLVGTFGFPFSASKRVTFLTKYHPPLGGSGFWKEHEKHGFLLEAQERDARRRWVHALDAARRQGEAKVAEGQPLDRSVLFAKQSMQEQLAGARNMNHRSVRWLYALQRRLNATEFSWPAQYDCAASGRGISASGTRRDQSLPLSAGKRGADGGLLTGERQHVVPYAHGRALEGTQGQSGRSGNGDVNGVGNLTWLSSRQNALPDSGGLGANWAVFNAEPPLNLRAHFLAPFRDGEAEESPTVLDHYEQLAAWSAGPRSKAETEAAAKTFQAFTTARVAWMQQAMSDWVDEVGSRLEAEFGVV